LWWSLWELCVPSDWEEKLTRSEGPFERGKGLKETRPLWPPQRGVGLREPNLGKTNPCVSPLYSLAICFTPSRGLGFISNANPACSCVYICKFQFRPIHPPLGDYQKLSTIVTLVTRISVIWSKSAMSGIRPRTNQKTMSGELCHQDHHRQ
jgi:hypothetical protein